MAGNRKVQLKFGRREELVSLEKIVGKSPIRVNQNKNMCCCGIRKKHRTAP